MHMLLLDLSARESESAVVQRRQWSSCSDSVIPTISHLFLQFRNSFLQFVHLVVVKPQSIVSCSPECNLEMTVNWKGKSVLIKRMQTNTFRINNVMRSCGEQLWTVVPTCIPRAPTPPLSRTPHQDNTRTLKVNGEPREWWDVLRILKWSLNTKCNVLRDLEHPLTWSHWRAPLSPTLQAYSSSTKRHSWTWAFAKCEATQFIEGAVAANRRIRGEYP